jgi:hypothetical protein
MGDSIGVFIPLIGEDIPFAMVEVLLGLGNVVFMM